MLPRGIFKSQVPAQPPLRFPQKLWKIANECKTGAVTWSPGGKSILVRYSLFKEEFMSTKSDFFKTDNISSFVRQLNLYGFRKGHEHAQKAAYRSNPDLHEFSNPFFQREKPDLLDKVVRKSGVLKDRNDILNEKPKFEFTDDASHEKVWGKVNSTSENADHTYLCSKQPKPSSEGSEVKTLELKIELVDCLQAKKEEASTPAAAATKSVSQDTVPPAPVKKKRGRKPGSKTNPYRLARKFKQSRKNFFSPVMKNAQRWPEFMYFDDDDDGVFLRNTSRDVMLSSTMSFQETVESLALKEIMQRMNCGKEGLGYGFMF